jgi:hypothetical protein
MHRAFTYRLQPTFKEAQALKCSMLLQCELYNAALEERRMSYEWQKRHLSTKKVPSKYDQFRSLTGLSNCGPISGPSASRSVGAPMRPSRVSSGG